MIIAYPLEDIRSLGKDKRMYQHAGIATKVVSVMTDMMILENKKGVRFPVNKNKLVWNDYGQRTKGKDQDLGGPDSDGSEESW